MREIILPNKLGKPNALAFTKDGSCFIGTSHGLYKFNSGSDTPKKLSSLLSMDVIIFENREGDEMLLQLTSESVQRLGPGCAAAIVLYNLTQDHNALREVAQAYLKASEVGRVRKLAVSSAKNLLFVTCKVDKADDTKGGSSYLWKCPIERIGSSRIQDELDEVLRKEPGNLWFMTICDKNEWIVVNNRHTGEFFSIDVFDFHGTHISQICSGRPNCPNLPGTINWPRGICVDPDEKYLYVVDNCNLQKFCLTTGQYVRTLASVPYIGYKYWNGNKLQESERYNIKGCYWYKQFIYCIGVFHTQKTIPKPNAKPLYVNSHQPLLIQSPM